MQEVRNLNNTRIKAESAEPSVSRHWLKLIGIYGGAALLFIMLGFIPAWLKGNEYKSERNALQNTLRPTVMQNKLASATINAYHGDYELARQQTSDFYTALEAETSRETSAFDNSQFKNAQEILDQRDEVITLLARGDAASAKRLTDLYFAFTQMKDSHTPQ